MSDTVTSTELARELVQFARPPCEVRAHRCGRPDRVCTEPAAWIDRYRCGCPTPGSLLTCEGHHWVLPLLVRDHVCTDCVTTPRIVGGERI